MLGSGMVVGVGESKGLNGLVGLVLGVGLVFFFLD